MNPVANLNLNPLAHKPHWLQINLYYTAYQQCATRLWYIIWMWDAVSNCLQPQPWYQNAMQPWPYLYFSKQPCSMPSATLQLSAQMPIHRLARWNNILHTYDMDVGCNQWGVNHDVTTSLGFTHPNFSRIHPHLLHRHDSVRRHTYAHPQQIKVLKHFVYIWYMDVGCTSWGFGVSTMTL